MSYLAIDTEFELTNPAWAKLAGFSTSSAPGTASYVPYCWLSPAAQKLAVAELQRLIDEAPVVVMHNNGVDCLVLMNVGIRIPWEKLHDTIVLAALFQAEEIGLKALAYEHFNVLMTELDDIIGTGKKRRDPTTVPAEEIADYACADADMTGRLWLLYEDWLRDSPATALVYDEIERPAFEAWVEMQRNGVLVDWLAFQELEVELTAEVQRLRDSLRDLAGVPDLNPNAPLQVANVLYKGMGLPVQTNIKTGKVSTDERSILTLWEKVDSPFLFQLLDYRGKNALLTRYLKTFRGLADAEGWLHPAFHPWGARRTGRVASSDPNFQNIPVRN